MTTTDELRTRARRALDASARESTSVSPATHGLPAGTPVTGDVLFTLELTRRRSRCRAAIADAAQAFSTWRTTPAPVRGALVRRLGELLAGTRPTWPPW